ncbi:hypothetical protein dsx2_0004 [Desulfovibrio sp. X2]|uniref:hypothetical protein n=1 Tax=Desulfovibrio sp. X2 TaxID=941449 RepID=UPI0003588E37|nr:hypothetical protein [Desulfovibrio sp. X2]EPR43780.1 hypothetical protein dsx2_0004 [Desulfovibrio sp. X2]
MSDLNNGQKPDFCIEIDFRPNTPNPERIFKFAASYIEALQQVDWMLAQSIDAKLRPVLLLEKVENGSIKVWLKEFFEAIDDDALKKIDWRPAVGKYLVKGKYIILEKLGAAKKLETREMVEQIASDINKLAQDTNVLHMPAYRPISARDIAYSAKVVSDATSILQEGESVSLVSDFGAATVGSDLSVTQEQIDLILASETIENTSTRILMVRRPDFLGNASWEFKYEKRRFDAKIEDDGWLARFRAGEIDIRPGDALKVKIFERTIYDRSGEVLDEHRVILKVIGVIREIRNTLPI